MHLSKRVQQIKEATFSLPRAAFHFPVGLFVGWLSYVNVPLAYLLGIGFLAYEISEDISIHDRAFKDILGYLFGLAVAAFIGEIILGG